MTISTHNPAAWICPSTNAVFTSRIHAENYADQNGVELVPLYKEATIPFLDRLQELIDNGAYILKQDEIYWLFTKYGEGICAGKTVREMMVNLVLTVC